MKQFFQLKEIILHVKFVAGIVFCFFSFIYNIIMYITINFLYLIDIIMHGVNCYYIQVFILVMRVLALGVQNVEKI